MVSVPIKMYPAEAKLAAEATVSVVAVAVMVALSVVIDAVVEPSSRWNHN
jgi:hypothetical protein